MKNAITWFEIGTANLASATAFYEAVPGQTMRLENIGPSGGAVFAYDPAADGTGGALMCGPTAPTPGTGGTLIYLDASPSLDAALARVTKAGGRIAVPRQALLPSMGFLRTSLIWTVTGWAFTRWHDAGEFGSVGINF